MMKRIIILILALTIIAVDTAESRSREDLKIACDGGAILLEYSTSKTLFEQNADKRWPPASIAKIMTAVIALEKGDLRDEVLFSQNACEQKGRKLGINTGMKVPLYPLIEAMLVNSGNDAAVAIAEHIAGSENEFAKLMNEKARAIGMMSTNFTNPNGLPDDKQYSTARDLSKLAVYAMGREDLRNIVSKREIEFMSPDGSSNVILYSTNRLLDSHPLVDGIKTGTTSKSKSCLAASAKFRDYRLIAIVLGAERKNVWSETAELLDWGFKIHDPMYPIYWELSSPIIDDSNVNNSEE
jgi:D-alanyl-D-alanine carboxypeptidase